MIIPTFNRSICGLLNQLSSQWQDGCELLVIDQSTDHSAALNRAAIASSSNQSFYYYHIAARGLPDARNFGIERARGEIVLFLDDDVILLSQSFIKAHLAAYDDPRVGGVTGRHVERSIRTNSNRTACHVALSGRTIYNLFGTSRQLIRSCKGSNMSFRMSAIRQVGGFDRRTHLLEDTDFSVRVRQAGWLLMFEPEAEVVHLSASNGGVRSSNELERQERRFSSTAYYVRKHRGYVGMVPFGIVFGLIAFKFAASQRSAASFFALLRAARNGLILGGLPPDDIIADSIGG